MKDFLKDLCISCMTKNIRLFKYDIFGYNFPTKKYISLNNIFSYSS